MSPNLRGNSVVIDALGSALRSGDHALSSVPGLLKRVLSEGSWREFVTKRGEHVTHERFADFVAAPPLQGLGATIGLVRRVVSDDKEALDLLDRELQRPVGRPLDPEIVDNVHNYSGRPDGNARDRAIRRLRSEAEQGNETAAGLHADVLAGRISAHAAMVQAGFRSRTISVPVGDPERTAASLRRHMSGDALVRLAELLILESTRPTAGSPAQAPRP